MARTSTIVIALLIAIGLVVAMLPAQDSSRRRASVYAGVSDSEADVAPAPEPGLIPVDETASPAPAPLLGHFAAPAIAAPGATPRSDRGVSPAGIFGKERRGEPSVTSQFEATTEAVSQEYTPTPAEVAPPASAVPMPAEASSSTDSPAGAASTGAATESAAAGSAETRSVLKRTKTAQPKEPTARPPLMPSMPASPHPTSNNGASSRRTVPTPTAPRMAARPSPSVASSIDTRSITAVAITGRSPALRVDVAGPQGITVGKPAGYLITIVNEGDTSAGDVQLRMLLPAFVNVAGSQTSSGEAGLQADAASGGSRLIWALPGVAARGHESLRLELVASEGHAFELGVEWAFKPTAIKAAIAVRQAQLQLSLAGPADMTFGEEKTFTLAVANPGNGDADNVVVNLSSGEGRRQQIEVGTLPAGQRKEVSVQIVASQAGEMEIHALAAADGGLSAEAAGKVIVRKAELAVVVAGPELKFAGSEATYQITVQNTGNAAADNVQLATSLPVASRYVGGIEGASPTGSSLKWKVANLPAGSERTFELRLVLNGAGTNRIAVQAQAPAAGTASGEIATLVEAAADLKLVVNDPSGPLATSELAMYEVQVMNRGSEAARQVKIVMQFGEGIEPIAIEGAQAKVVPGQVVCQPLAELGPGEQVTMRVKARADRAGTHQFRVEVTASESESRLVSEGTTRFFAESGRGGSAAAATARKPTLVPQGGTYQR